MYFPVPFESIVLLPVCVRCFSGYKVRVPLVSCNDAGAVWYGALKNFATARF